MTRQDNKSHAKNVSHSEVSNEPVLLDQSTFRADLRQPKCKGLVRKVQKFKRVV